MQKKKNSVFFVHMNDCNVLAFMKNEKSSVLHVHVCVNCIKKKKEIKKKKKN